MALAAQLSFVEDEDRRADQREGVMLDAEIEQPEAGTIDVIVHDLSLSGFLAEADGDFPPGSEVWIHLAGRERRRAHVRWHAFAMMGCEFETPLRPYELATALSESTVISPGLGDPSELNSRRGNHADELVERLPLRSRAAVIVGGALLLWCLLGLVVFLARRHGFL